MPLDGSVPLEKFNESPSVSDADKLPLTGVSSSVVAEILSPSGLPLASVMIGVSLVGLTPTFTVIVSVPPWPSDTMTEKLSSPLKSSFGV